MFKLISSTFMQDLLLCRHFDHLSWQGLSYLAALLLAVAAVASSFRSPPPPKPESQATNLSQYAELCFATRSKGHRY